MNWLTRPQIFLTSVRDQSSIAIALDDWSLSYGCLIFCTNCLIDVTRFYLMRNQHRTLPVNKRHASASMKLDVGDDRLVGAPVQVTGDKIPVAKHLFYHANVSPTIGPLYPGLENHDRPNGGGI